QQERAEIVRLAVESLPEPQKMAIILSHYQSLNYNDIARILKCSKGTVKSRVFRAKLKLKQLLTDYMMGKEKERVSDEVQKDNENTSSISR
ncbi:MAG: sigma-70 family RNA polymerase sigma factor, partial [Thermoplasmata archaeon]|nr:sigma-70 family RNA polymerase sigma factor [Thermoplasmata archaeon]